MELELKPNHNNCDDACTCIRDSIDPQCPEHASIAPDWTL